VAGRQGLTASAEAARRRLLQFITRLGRAASRMKRPRTGTLVEASTR